MKKFKFTLDAALSLRRHKERLVMQEVGTLVQELGRVDSEMAALEQEKIAVEQGLARRMETGLSGAELQGTQGYIARVAVRWQEEAALRDKVHGYLDIKRGELARCAVARKAMETLREREHEAFGRFQEDEMRKQQEETALVHRAAMARNQR